MPTPPLPPVVPPVYNTTDFWDPAKKAGGTQLDQGNKRAFTGFDEDSVLSVIGHATGKWQIHFEVQGFQAGSIQNESGFGIATDTVDLDTRMYQSTTGDNIGLQLAFISSSWNWYIASAFTTGGGDVSELIDGATVSTPTTIDCLVDLDALEVKFMRAGVLVGSTHSIPPGLTWYADTALVYQTGAVVCDLDATSFTPESGYKSWNQTN